MIMKQIYKKELVDFKQIEYWKLSPHEKYDKNHHFIGIKLANTVTIGFIQFYYNY